MDGTLIPTLTLTLAHSLYTASALELLLCTLRSVYNRVIGHCATYIIGAGAHTCFPYFSRCSPSLHSASRSLNHLDNGRGVHPPWGTDAFCTLFQISLFQYISHYFKNFLLPPNFSKFPLCFRQIYVFFLHTLCVFRFPYFYHNAFMHHTMRVLDAPGQWRLYRRTLSTSNKISSW